jgi:hypothetical protein
MNNDKSPFLKMSLNLDSQLLEALFETISNEVHVLEAVKNSDHFITGFKSLMGNKGDALTMESWIGNYLINL